VETIASFLKAMAERSWALKSIPSFVTLLWNLGVLELNSRELNSLVDFLKACSDKGMPPTQVVEMASAKRSELTVR